MCADPHVFMTYLLFGCFAVFIFEFSFCSWGRQGMGHGRQRPEEGRQEGQGCDGENCQTGRGGRRGGAPWSYSSMLSPYPRSCFAWRQFRRACRAGLEQRTQPLDLFTLPLGACALTLREAAPQTTMRRRTQRECAAASSNLHRPDPPSERNNHEGICSAGNEVAGPGAAWANAPVAELEGVQRRPKLHQQADGLPSPVQVLAATPAGSAALAAAFAAQATDIAVRGVLVAYRSQAWVLAQGWSAQLGRCSRAHPPWAHCAAHDPQ